MTGLQPRHSRGLLRPAARSGRDERALSRTAVLSRMRLLLHDQRKPVLAMTFVAAVAALVEALTLALIAEVAASVVKAGGAHSQRLGLFHIHGSTDALILFAFIASLVRLALQVPLSTLPARIAADAQARMRMDLLDSFTGAPWAVQSRDREGQLQETMTSQLTQASVSVLNLLGLITSLLTFLILLASALLLNLAAAGIVLLVACGLFAFMRPLRGLTMRQARALSRAQVRYAAGIAESNRLAVETHVFGAAPAQRRRVDELIAACRKLFFQTQVLLRLSARLSQSLVYLLLVGGLIVLHHADPSHIAALAGVILILVRASSYGQTVQASYQGLVQSIPFVERTQEAERRYRQSAVVEGTRSLEHVRSIVFEGVGYAYRPEQPVLSDVSFAVDGAEAIGVIGPSGAGKSTLVQLLLGLRTPDRGRYLVNAVPEPELAPADWHRLVAYVPQEPHLLHASVADNIRYFRDLDDDAVERAARLARIHDDVIGWAQGYETIVGPRADAVSGGQQQRICLARALAARPQLLVLDEPTSALDPKSEILIQQSLSELEREHELMLFIVAHRMSTLDICDRVMIIIGGRLVAFDTISNLQQHNHYYRSASRLAGASGGSIP
jgi:ATP-binding cassette, subfamily B, bacterial